MPERTIRFTVTKPGHQSGTWKLWTTTGGGKHDFYLACREVGGSLKVSFHQTGSWHVGFLRPFVDETLDENDPKRVNPYVAIWKRPPEKNPGLTLAYRIVVPASAVNVSTQQPLADSIFQIPAAPQGKAVEIAVYLLSPTAKCANWPASRNGSKPVGKLSLDNSETVWVVYYLVDLPQLPELPVGRVSSFKCARAADSIDGVLRGLVFGGDDVESRWTMECATSGDFSVLNSNRN